MRTIVQGVLFIIILLLINQCGSPPTATNPSMTDEDTAVTDNTTVPAETSATPTTEPTTTLATAIPQETPTPAPATIDDADEIYAELVARFGEDYNACQVDVSSEAVCEVPDILTGSDPSEVPAIQIILDSSGSMAGEIDGQSKMSSAQAALLEFIQEVPETAQIALRVYGHTGSNEEIDRAESCQGTELLYPFQQLDIATFETAIASFEPTGWTPIARSLEAAQTDFAAMSSINANFIYLVSDGIETCDGDPVTAARTLHESDIQAVINVIGFDVDAETAAQLQAIAEAGGGEYVEARSREDIEQAFQATATAMQEYYECVSLQEQDTYTTIADAAEATYDCINEKADREYNNITEEIEQNYEEGLYDDQLRSTLINRASNQRTNTINEASDERTDTTNEASDERTDTINEVSDERTDTTNEASDDRTGTINTPPEENDNEEDEDGLSDQ